MRYLERRFSVPVAGPNVTQEEWNRIFGEKPRRCWWQEQIDEGKKRARVLGKCEHLTHRCSVPVDGERGAVTCVVCGKELTKKDLEFTREDGTVGHWYGWEFASDDLTPENPGAPSEKSVLEEIKEEVASWPEELREQLDKELGTKSYSGRPLTDPAPRGSIKGEEVTDGD